MGVAAEVRSAVYELVADTAAAVEKQTPRGHVDALHKRKMVDTGWAKLLMGVRRTA